METHSSGWCWECKFLVHDVIFAQRNNKEDTKEASADSQGDQLSNILLGKRREKSKAVHGRNAADIDDTKASSSCSSPTIKVTISKLGEEEMQTYD
jgi:hypothetical protein